MWMWFPWRFIVSRFARSQGFIDPISLLSRLHRFAQPSEVAEPIELLRAGVVFHARGLINARAIQHNLDWVWPFWVERQFDPRDVAFVPRAFSITHINLTHRNWTAVGQPDCDWLPIVDPRGLVTPLYDGWSIDTWIVPEDGEPLLPSRAANATQRLVMDDELAVQTDAQHEGHTLHNRAEVVMVNGQPRCQLQTRGQSDQPGWLVVAIRPANPEGVSFISDIRKEPGGGLRVDKAASVHFDASPDRLCMSRYRDGDVLQDLVRRPPVDKLKCDVGLATAAVMFRLQPGVERQITTTVPLVDVANKQTSTSSATKFVCENATAWGEALRDTCELRVPDERMQFLFDAAKRSLVLHAAGEVYPGPYTYKRFWFRDAAFILDALLALGMHSRVRRCIDRFADRQTTLGYFRSQEGEWDSNGAALWIIERYRRLSAQPLTYGLLDSVKKGGKWIRHKRLRDDLDKPHAGLLPAGFSAEHLGPNDFYYWDDFWSIAGLEAAADLLEAHEELDPASAFRDEAAKIRAAIDRSIDVTAHRRDRPGVPASPYRRMDAGAIGSVAAGYPLRVWEAEDPRLLDTIEFLMDNCRVHGGFFQDMIHSGVNPYLTLHMAQVLLRAGDPRQEQLVRAVAELATPTGQWPEAIHPHTRGGCMGDGQHIWAAAEWVLMMRNWFVREEGQRLILGSGLPAEWLNQDQKMSLGPTPTPFGPITVSITPGSDNVEIAWDARFRDEGATIEVHLPDCDRAHVTGQSGSIRVARRKTRGPREVESWTS